VGREELISHQAEHKKNVDPKIMDIEKKNGAEEEPERKLI
jgi:hypothetical protein